MKRKSKNWERFKGQPTFIQILHEMLSRVGAKFDTFNFSKDQWYLTHEWTEQEQESFKQWLMQFLKSNKLYRQEMMQYPRADLKSLEKIASEFIFQYGWKVKP